MRRKMDNRIIGAETFNKGVAVICLKVVVIKSNSMCAKLFHTFKFIAFVLLLLDLELDTILCSFTPSAGSAKSCPWIMTPAAPMRTGDRSFFQLCFFQLNLFREFLGALIKCRF